MRAPALATFALLLGACGGGENHFEVDSPTPVEGTSGETVRIGLRLLDVDDGAVDGVQVRFMLDGAPDGTSLRDELATTDSRGGVTAILTLGADGTFTLLATAEGATPAMIDVRIGAAGTAYTLCAADPMGCNSPETCIEVTTSTTTGAICTASCVTAADCPAAPPRGAQCVNFQGLGATCMRGCAIAEDCNDSDECVRFTDLSGVESTICIPTE